MKLGATARPSATRRSVSCSARRTNFSRAAPLGPCASAASSTGNTPPPCPTRPNFFSCSMLASAWPVCMSLTISSNNREIGTLDSSADIARTGRSVPGLQRKTQLGREAHHADDAHRVFAVAQLGVADHAQHAGARIRQATVVVDHGLRHRVVVHRVDREVAPRGVFDLRAPDVVAQHAAFGVDHVGLVGQLRAAGLLVAGHLFGGGGVQVGTEGRDLDGLVLAPAAEHHVHQAEATADDEGAAEQRLHLLGRGRRWRRRSPWGADRPAGRAPRRPRCRPGSPRPSAS